MKRDREESINNLRGSVSPINRHLILLILSFVLLSSTALSSSFYSQLVATSELPPSFLL